jgi:hypothetical protein
MLEITEVLSSLAHERPFFYSEADFQHAFAWEIHKKLPFARVGLEIPVPVGDHGQDYLHIDVWVAYENAILAVELKYKTRGLTVKIDNQHDSMNEHYSLKDQGAQEIGRYDFLKDIQRLEQVVDGHQNFIGYAVLLTNDSAYWQEPRKKGTVDADFRLHHGRVVEGDLTWRKNAAAGTKRGREQLHLQGRYQLHWSSYSFVEGHGNYREFRSLVVKVSPNN